MLIRKDGRARTDLGRLSKHGAPGEIRTPDLLLRRQPLYPAELRARIRHLQFTRVRERASMLSMLAVVTFGLRAGPGEREILRSA
jgi:hypothetical protein